MSSTSSDALKRTPLHAWHVAHHARMVDFAGWHMPVDYGSVVDEHMAVRTAAGLFDVSHMGQVEIAGRDALGAVQWLSSNDAARLAVGQAQYSALTTPQGTFVDDLVVYRLAPEHFLLIINASNIAKDVRWISDQVAARGGDVAVVNSSSRYALVALQGPTSAAALAELTDVDLADLQYYWFTHGEVAGVRSVISRTGYTGEDGFELLIPSAQAPRLWEALLRLTTPVRPCGLGARDTLRLEAGFRLYGNDMDETVSVLEAGLGWTVDWNKTDFIAAEALAREKAAGSSRKLVPFVMSDRAIARHGHAVVRDGAVIGQVTSGTHAPFLKQAIGFALVPVDASAVGASLTIDIRGRLARAEVVRGPFYKRGVAATARP